MSIILGETTGLLVELFVSRAVAVVLLCFGIFFCCPDMIMMLMSVHETEYKQRQLCSYKKCRCLLSQKIKFSCFTITRWIEF